MNFSKDMQILNLEKLVIADMITRYNKIISHGVEFPTEHHQHITKYALLDAFEKGQANLWASGLRCRALGEVPEWDIQQPAFVGCMPANKEEAEASKFKDTFHSTAFCAPFMKAMSKVLQGGHTASFIKSCLLYTSPSPRD